MRKYLPGSICMAAASLATVLAAVSLAPVPAAGQNFEGVRPTPPPPAGPTPRLPNDPYLRANSGKPDLGGNSQGIDSKMRGIWQVPYIIDMQKQGCTLGDQKCYASLGKQHTTPVEVPFTALGKKV